MERKRLGQSFRVGALLTALASVATIAGAVFAVMAIDPALNPFIPHATPTPMLPTYFAAVPGPGCDHGTGSWVGDNRASDGTLTCSSTGMTLVNSYSGRVYNFVVFAWPGHPFARDYRVEVDVSGLEHGWAAVETRADDSGLSSYLFLIDSQGDWYIYRDDAGQRTLLVGGQVRASATYHLNVADIGTMQELSVNGGPVATAVDGTYANTSQLRLFVEDNRTTKGDAAATFSNFRYTPLSL